MTIREITNASEKARAMADLGLSEPAVVSTDGTTVVGSLHTQDSQAHYARVSGEIRDFADVPVSEVFKRLRSI